MTAFFAASEVRTELRCPVQPGNLSSFYFGEWTKDGITIVRVPQPSRNGEPRNIVKAMNNEHLDLNRETFSLIIDSANRSRDASNNYSCVLHYLIPATGSSREFTQASSLQLSLTINGELRL